MAQLTSVDSSAVLSSRKEELLRLMRRHAKTKGFDLMLLMLTDVLQDGTMVLFVGDDEDAICQAFNVKPEDAADNVVFLQKIMSRKKQVIPMLSALWG